MGANWYTGVNLSTPVYTINFNGLQERRAAFGVHLPRDCDRALVPSWSLILM